jgi:hypothetical protein
MMKNRGIAFKLVFLVLISDAAILVFIFEYNYRVSRQIIEKKIPDNACNLVGAISTIFSLWIKTIFVSPLATCQGKGCTQPFS